MSNSIEMDAALNNRINANDYDIADILDVLSDTVVEEQVSGLGNTQREG